MPTTTEKLQEALREIGISADNPQDFFLYDYRSPQERPITAHFVLHQCKRKGDYCMSAVTSQKQTAPVVRQYEIGGVRYIVKATVKDGAKETAVKKIRRLLQNDLSKAAT